MYACLFDLLMTVIFAEGTAGGRVPYKRMPNVGVIVGAPGDDAGCVAEAVNVGIPVPGVAVAGVVVRLGIGVLEGASEVASIISSVVGEDAITGVVVWMGGAFVGEG